MQAKRRALKPKTKAVERPAEAFLSLVHDYLQDKRAAGASPRTVNHYQEALKQVLLPFCADAGIAGSADLTTRHLNELQANGQPVVMVEGVLLTRVGINFRPAWH